MNATRRTLGSVGSTHLGIRKPWSPKQWMPVLVLLGMLPTVARFAQSQNVPGPLNFENNFFVTGDYIVAGAYNMTSSHQTINGVSYAVGTINVPDKNSKGAANPGIQGPTSVPKGAQIVAALLYWQTVEKAGVQPGQTGSGENGFFRPVIAGGVAAPGYAIQGTNISGTNTVSWSSGGCNGGSTGKLLRTYRADVGGALPLDPTGGNPTANGTFEVRLPSSGNATPLTLGATLVVIYRVPGGLGQPLNAIVIYDGDYAQSNSALTMTQSLQGFYDADHNTVSKLTHIVGGGQSNKFQTVYLGSGANKPVALPLLYGNKLPAFPGWYGNWDNTTWLFNGANPVAEDSSSITTQVVPAASMQGCVSWGAIIVSTTVKNSDGDGILDSWKKTIPPGYCDASVNNGMCSKGDLNDPGWIDLAGAAPGQKDIFLQYDYLCSSVLGPASLGPTNSCKQPFQQQSPNYSASDYSFDPRLALDPNGNSAIDRVVEAFTNHSGGTERLALHAVPGNAILEGQSAVSCTDSSPSPTCPFAQAPGTIGFREGLTYIKNQNIDSNTGLLCTPGTQGCGGEPVFQHGKKDSYHYVLFSHGVGLPSWFLSDGSLLSVSQLGNTVTFTTSSPHGIAPIAGDFCQFGRVTVVYAISNNSLEGTYCVLQKNLTATTFAISVGGAATKTTVNYTKATDPNLAVANGQVTSMSGFSDVGGQNSVVSLGFGEWGPPNNPTADGNTWQTKAGTFMHELGHTLGLTHGGTFYQNLPGNDYTPTFEPNCKPNSQSIMNYQFQVDLLTDSNGNQVLDYSQQDLNPLNKKSSLTAGILGGALYQSTAWFELTSYAKATNPALTPNVMSAHCDGSPRPVNAQGQLTDQDMTYVSGAAGSFFSSNANPNTGLDVNYDGNTNETLHGHDEWEGSPASGQVGPTPGLDLQQVSSVGTISTVGLGGESGALKPAGGGGALKPAGGGGALKPAGGGGALKPAGGGGLKTDINHQTANSYTRPPRNLAATEAISPRTITLTWTQPTFGQIVQYNVYRAVVGGQFQLLASVVPAPPATTFPPTTYQDNPSCNPAGYSYEVTALVNNDTPPPQLQESLPSNVATVPGPNPLTGCYVETGLTPSTFSARQGSPVDITWTLDDDFYTTDGPVNRAAANTLVAVGPNPNNGCAYGRATLVLNGVVQSVNGVPAGPPLSGSGGQFDFILNTDVLCAGSYTFELDLDSGQTATTAPPLQLSIDVTDNDGPTITTTSLPDAFVVLAYSQTISQDGGVPPLTWSVAPGSNPLPAGLAIGSKPGDPSSGLLSGTPTTPGIYNFTVDVTDSANSTGMQAFTMRVIPPVPQINQPSLPDASNPTATPPTLTLNGMGFVPNSMVLWNGTPLTTNYISATKLTATAPSLARGTASISVSSPLVSSSNVDLFQTTESTSAVALSSPTPNLTGTNPTAVTTGDFNGDGKTDLAIANGDGTVTILLGQGDGTFLTQPPLNASTSASSLAVGDFNHDGKLDLAVAASGTPGMVAIFLGNGDGTFEMPTFSPVGNAPTSVIAGDFNRDGKLDLAVANSTDHTVSILLGNGDGTFQNQVPYPAGITNVSAVALGDFNSDNKLDLSVTNPTDGTVSVLLGNGDGTFLAPVTYQTGMAVTDQPAAVSVADLNGDGKLDLAVTNLNAKTVGILLGKGDGTFNSTVVYPTTTGTLSGPGAVVAGDFNADNKVDLAITNEGNNTVSILLGNGDGTFQPATEFSVGNSGDFTAGVAAGDFNGDGRLDVAVADQTNTNVSVMLQRPQSPTNLATGTVTGGSVALSWTASISSDVVGYNVYRATSSGGYTPGTPLISLPPGTLTYTDTSVASGTTYYYVVTAVIANNLESTNSNEVSATPTTPLAAPTNVSGSLSFGEPSISWTASTSSGVTGYNVYRGTSPTGPFILVGNSTGVASTSFLDANASGAAACGGTAFYYEVTTVGAGNVESTPSNVTNPGITVDGPC